MSIEERTLQEHWRSVWECRSCMGHQVLCVAAPGTESDWKQNQHQCSPAQTLQNKTPKSVNTTGKPGHAPEWIDPMSRYVAPFIVPPCRLNMLMQYADWTCTRHAVIWYHLACLASFQSPCSVGCQLAAHWKENTIYGQKHRRKYKNAGRWVRGRVEIDILVEKHESFLPALLNTIFLITGTTTRLCWHAQLNNYSKL